MNAFSGVSKYQSFRRKEVMDKGYILISPVTGHKSFIYNYDELLQIKNKFNKEYWEEYRRAKSNEEYNHPYIKEVRHFFKEKSDMEKASINYVIQGSGALCFKVALILLFEYILKNNLFNIVKFCIGAHDEINIECPTEMSEEIGKVLVDKMVEAGKFFCDKCPLGADINIDDYWVH